MGVTPLYCNLNYPTVTNKMIQKNTTNRRRSFKRRRLEGICCWIGVAVICVLLQNVAKTEAVPMDSGFMRIHSKLTGIGMGGGGPHLWHHRRVSRDVAMAIQSASQQQQQKDNTKEALMQGSSTEITVDQPQGQCLLDGEYVPETTVFCEKQVGCRAIQKTGHCCPDYKCDCQKDGKTYLNGDKLVDPETPCTVCYCQGGEILCSSVTCFHRDDCTPKYIPGVCCPEYDNCPVATSESSVNKTLTMTTTTMKPEMPAAENNPKITIKEITKPIEIRITDNNKAIPIHQMLKPTTTTTSTTTTTTTTTTSSTSTTTILTSPSTPQPPTMPTTADQTPLVDAIKLAVQEKLNEEVGVEKLSADTTHAHGGNAAATKGGLNSGDTTLKLTASVAYPPPSPTTVLSSTLASIESSVEVDDPVPALSVFSTQGLPEDPSKVNIKREYFITTEGVASAPQVYDGLGSGEYPNTELIYSGGSSPTQQSSLVGATGLQQTSAELDPDTAGSDNIYHIILTTDGPRLATTSENYLALKGSASTEGSPFEDLSAASAFIPDGGPVDNMASAASTTEGPDARKHDYYMKSSTESSLHQHLDEDEIPLEINPAYPSLPADDFSIRGDNNYQLSDNDDVGEEPRSIGGHGSHAGHVGHDVVKNSKHLEDVGSYGSGSGSGMGMMVEELVALPSSTEGSGGMDLNSKYPSVQDQYEKNMRAPEIIQFMYSGEDSSEETRITNSSDFQVDTEKKSEDSSLESTEVLKPIDILMSSEYGSGSGAGEIKQQKEREPTTPRPYKGASSSVDIDELQGSSSGNGPQDDPKEDAESLKLDDTAADTTANSGKSPKGNILSVKVQTAQQEKAFYDDLV